MLKKILLAVVAIVAILIIVVALQPSTFRVARSITVAAPPAEAYAQVHDFHKWQEWSPWAKLDPNAKATFEGPESGVGAVFKWSGNDEVGEGSMTILESKPDELIRIRLDFLKPFKDTSEAEFTFQPKGDKTEVTWSMRGENGFMEKAFCLVMNMDKLLGEKFDEGLGNLKTIVEKESTKSDGAVQSAR